MRLRLGPQHELLRHAAQLCLHRVRVEVKVTDRVGVGGKGSARGKVRLGLGLGLGLCNRWGTIPNTVRQRGTPRDPSVVPAGEVTWLGGFGGLIRAEYFKNRLKAAVGK